MEQELILDKYARYARDLGRLPATGDLHRKRKEDATFPSPSTFRNRLGPKVELVEKLLEYCRAHSRFADVVQMCEDYLRAHVAGYDPGPKTRTLT